MNEFLKSVLILSVVIAIFTAIGTVTVFNHYIGKHILRLKRLNTMNRGAKVARWRFKDIPSNEVGDLIIEREELLDRIQQKPK